MRDIARLAALFVAGLVVARDLAVAGSVPAMRTASFVVLAVVVLALTLWREGFVTASGVALGVHYALALHYGDVLADYAAPVVAALVVVHVDLLDLAASIPRERVVDRVLLRSRLRHAGGVFVVGVVASSLALVVASFRWPSSTLTRAIGLAGIALAVVIPLGLLRERR